MKVGILVFVCCAAFLCIVKLSDRYDWGRPSKRLEQRTHGAVTRICDRTCGTNRERCRRTWRREEIERSHVMFQRELEMVQRSCPMTDCVAFDRCLFGFDLDVDLQMLRASSR